MFAAELNIVCESANFPFEWIARVLDYRFQMEKRSLKLG